MGSFNVACSASHISINYGDPCLILPLKKQRHPASLETSMIVTNEGACGIFAPWSLPVVGVYDDYGRICDVKDSVTSRLLKEKVGDVAAWLSDVDDDMIGRYGSEKPHHRPDALMFIHADIYEFMTLPDSSNNMLEESFATYYALEELGFTKLPDVIKPENMVSPNSAHGMKRYNQPWKHDSSDKFYVCSDGGKFLVIGEKTPAGWIERESIYRLKELGRVWKKRTGHSFGLKTYKDIPANDYIVRSTINEYPKALERSRKYYGEGENKYRIMLGSHDMEFLWGIRMMDAEHLFDLYGPILAGEEPGSEELASELANFKTFLHNMYRANKLLMPAMNGPQFGDEEYVRDLSKKVQKICNETIKSRRY